MVAAPVALEALKNVEVKGCVEVICSIKSLESKTNCPEVAFQMLNERPPIVWITSKSPSLSVSPEYLKPLNRPINLLFLRMFWSGKAVESKVKVEILAASTTEPNSLESPSLAEKTYPCPLMVE